jgi:hypothetical protein
MQPAAHGGDGGLSIDQDSLVHHYPRKPVSNVAAFFVDLSLSLFSEFPDVFDVSVNDDGEFMNLLRNAAAHEATVIPVSATLPQQQTPIRDVNRLVREKRQGPSGILSHSAAVKTFLLDKAKADAHLAKVREEVKRDVAAIGQDWRGGQQNTRKYDRKKDTKCTSTGKTVTFTKDGKKVTRVVHENQRGTNVVKYNDAWILLSKLKI